MDNSVGWGSYSLVNAYIWALFGLAVGVGFFASPWTAVMYAVSAMSANLIVRRIIAIKRQPVGETYDDIDEWTFSSEKGSIFDIKIYLSMSKLKPFLIIILI